MLEKIAQLKSPMADERSAPDSGTGSSATPQSNFASFTIRSSSHGPEIAMAALPELKVPVESHWPRVSVSGEASFSVMMVFQMSSALTAPSELICS
ncbi:hypothetical protein D9M72_566820 [compost metagenome]